VDANTFRHLGDRPAGIQDEANGLVLLLLGEASACRHASTSAAVSGSLRPGVYKIGNGPVADNSGLVLGKPKPNVLCSWRLWNLGTHS
jgi:hypothetical protein